MQWQQILLQLAWFQQTSWPRTSTRPLRERLLAVRLRRDATCCSPTGRVRPRVAMLICCDVTYCSVCPLQAQIPYQELYSFHVITGEGNRKPGISFEHKPDAAKRGQDIRVWMPKDKATDCADKLMQMLGALAQQPAD
jgi:hypothetical protein|eukprot:COSAG06_NODE_4214_length_4468_cov_10.307780_5_plen_138_part_00